MGRTVKRQLEELELAMRRAKPQDYEYLCDKRDLLLERIEPAHVKPPQRRRIVIGD